MKLMENSFFPGKICITYFLEKKTTVPNPPPKKGGFNKNCQKKKKRKKSKLPELQTKILLTTEISPHKMVVSAYKYFLKNKKYPNPPPNQT